MVWDLCALCESLLYIESYPMSHSNLLDCCKVCMLMLWASRHSLAPNAIELVGTSANDAPMSLIDELKKRFQLGLAYKVSKSSTRQLAILNNLR